MIASVAVPWMFVAGLLLQGPALPVPVVEEIGRADQVVVYEGLPHQMHERELRQHELASGNVVRMEGVPFYAAEIAPTSEDAATLARIVSDPASFAPYGGYKSCGGFHPDFLVEWRTGPEGTPTRLHLCFGCLEMKAYGPGGEVHVEIAEAAARELLLTLKKYGDNRPDSRARRNQWNALLDGEKK